MPLAPPGRDGEHHLVGIGLNKLGLLGGDGYPTSYLPSGTVEKFSQCSGDEAGIRAGIIQERNVMFASEEELLYEEQHRQCSGSALTSGPQVTLFTSTRLVMTKLKSQLDSLWSGFVQTEVVGNAGSKVKARVNRATEASFTSL